VSSLATQPARAGGEFAIGGDLPVVRLGYGSMQIPGPGVWGEPRDHDEVIRVLRRALELGVTFIDTAIRTAPGVSERLIREALHPCPDDLVIAKAGLTRPGPGRWGQNGKPEYLKAQAEKSLPLLGVERIGLSNVTVPEIHAARAITPIATVQDLSTTSPTEAPSPSWSTASARASASSRASRWPSAASPDRAARCGGSPRSTPSPRRSSRSRGSCSALPSCCRSPAPRRSHISKRTWLRR